MTSIGYVERQFQIHFVFYLIISYVNYAKNKTCITNYTSDTSNALLYMYLYIVHLLLHCKMSQLLHVKIFTHISVAFFPLNCRDFFSDIGTESGCLILKSMINV